MFGALPISKKTEASDKDNRLIAMIWHPTTKAAHERLNAFLPKAAGAYASSRNYDHGPEDRSNVSALSPWVRHRMLLEEDVLRAVLQRHGERAAEKFIQEVIWRTYFKGWLEQYPKIWSHYMRDLEALAEELQRDLEFSKAYKTACTGKTGIDCFDHWVRELIEIGYLHNHTRMWFASIWVFTLKLPWQLGADFFYRHLLDGDPASNTLSWRWVGGLHTKGKTYLARPDNIEKYTAGQFAPHGQLARDAPPFLETEPIVIEPIRSPDGLQGLGRYGLLVTAEDCLPERLSLPHAPVAIFGLTSTPPPSPFESSDKTREFTKACVNDAAVRAATHFKLSHVTDNHDNWISALQTVAETHDLQTFVTAFTPVGPAADEIARARQKLSSIGIEIKMVQRPYDRIIWPHASKGFFKVKRKIPQILDELGLRKQASFVF